MPKSDLSEQTQRPVRAFDENTRLSILARVLESFTATLDLDEVLRRIVDTTLHELDVDRAWLIHPASLEAEFATVSYEATRSPFSGAFEQGVPIPLEGSRKLLTEMLASGAPVISFQNDLDPFVVEKFHVRSQLAQVLNPRNDQPWAFGVHQCSDERKWSEAEVALFAEIGRYATIALNNALLHKRAVAEAAKVAAIIDQIPEAVTIFGPDGKIERLNAAAARELGSNPPSYPPARIELSQARESDGRVLTSTEAPSVRALRGEVVSTQYLTRDRQTSEDRFWNVRATPIRDEHNAVIGAVVVSSDVSDERRQLQEDVARRRRAECLANLGLDLFSSQTTLGDLNESAGRIARSIDANVRIYLYQKVTDVLQLVGSSFHSDAGHAFRDYIEEHPFRPGEGLPGTVFQIGRALLFSEIRGDAVSEYGRDAEERRLLDQLAEQCLVACPIESYGERIGVLVISSSDEDACFDAEDLGFAQQIAERFGAAVHIHRLTRVAQDGHRAAEELARREVHARTRLESVLDFASVGIAVVSADELRFELVNPPFGDYAAYFGRISPDTKLVGYRVAEVIPGLEQTLRQAAELGETRIDEAVRIDRGSDSLYVKQIISPVRGRYSGITQALTILVQDVTEEVRTKREIEALAQIMEERSARLTSILGSMTDALLVYDSLGRVIDVNPAALSMFGIGSRSEAVMRGSLEDLDLRYPDGKTIPADDMPYARALRGEAVPDYLAVGRHLLTGRDLDLSIAVAPIESGGIVGAVLVIRDITALQELDRKKDEFLSVASHELRTPLTTIKGYTQLLAQTMTDLTSQDRENYLRAVLGEIDRMMGLISELLDVSRIETKRLQVEVQPIQWGEFLARRVSAFRVQNADRTIMFEDRFPDEVSVHIDADRMRQVVDNLLSNAMKYSPEGTPIEVRIEAYPDRVETSFIDSGIGIPRDEIPRLFERFHRARNVSSRYYGGLGLGLYIAKAIVEAHHGSIQVESVEGEGSTFTIVLPTLTSDGTTADQ